MLPGVLPVAFDHQLAALLLAYMDHKPGEDVDARAVQKAELAYIQRQGVRFSVCRFGQHLQYRDELLVWQPEIAYAGYYGCGRIIGDLIPVVMDFLHGGQLSWLNGLRTECSAPMISSV